MDIMSELCVILGQQFILVAKSGHIVVGQMYYSHGCAQFLPTT